MKTKGLISFTVTAKLICVFVFAYAKRWFSHDAAQIFVSGAELKWLTVVHALYVLSKSIFSFFPYLGFEDEI